MTADPLVADAIKAGTAMLKKSGIEGAARDVCLLMAATLGVAPDRMTLHLRDRFGPVDEAAFFASISDRAEHMPVSHIIGGRWFYGRWFSITRDVLDPRPETETLIQAALGGPFSEVLDLGIGSGCILVTLLAERPAATGTGTDISDLAVQAAIRNATALGVDDRCWITRSNWFDAIDGQFDLIVSNPPYIPADEMEHLQPEVRDHEPRAALTDEGDGLSAYRIISAGAMDHLTPGGRLLVEIGPTQAPPVSELFAVAGLADIGVQPDLDGRDRVVSARRAAR